MKALVEGGEVIEPLRERVGRVAGWASSIPTQETAIAAGTLLDEDTVEITSTSSASTKSVCVHRSQKRVTAFAHVATVAILALSAVSSAIGEKLIGVIAAPSIGEPGTQLTMRTFHIGGALPVPQWPTASRPNRTAWFNLASTMRCVDAGPTLRSPVRAEIVIFGENERERERHKVPYGATLQVNDGDMLKAGTRLANWDPLTRPIISEYAGAVRFENIEEGGTVAKQVDEVTGARPWSSSPPRLVARSPCVRRSS